MHFLKEILLQLFIALMPFVMFNIYYRDKTQNYSKNFIIVTSALCLFLCMTFSPSIEHGIIFDVRSVIMLFGILFGGLKAGLILLVEFVAYRLYIGGPGKWVAMIILSFTFPLSLFLYKIYQKGRRTSFIIFIAGILFSFVSSIVTYFYNPKYVLDHLQFHIFSIPVQNCLGIWLLISLFKKSVSDKNLFIRMAQDEKFKAISHVAASLAHEVRNPLTAVHGFLKLIRQSSQDQRKIQQYVDISLNEIQRTETILSEYLSITKPITDRRVNTDFLHELQVTMEVMTPYAILNNVSLELEEPDENIRIMANADEVKQMLHNFIKNSVEACAHIVHGRISIRLKKEASNMVLEIEDNGIGMNNSQIKRLGTIYYSTKSSGTGLGLTFSYQVVHTLGGLIFVHSKPGEGTTFRITIPLVTENAQLSRL